MEYRSLEHKIRDLWIAENNRNTEIRRKVENVGRPKDNVKDETSKLGKQGEIKTKIVDEEVIDEAADGDVGNVVADKKKPKPKDKDDSDKSSDKAAKKDTDMDDMEAKTIKGGKTEVDTEPKTDDSTENSTDEDKKSKKARNQENKTIGAKGVKEETMLRSDKNHGSSQSLIDAITEALKGKQHKIDANHNGKIDGQDFKILKGKKKVEEETEELDEKSPYAYVNKAVSHKLKGKKADLGDNLKAASEHEPYGKHSPDSKVFRDRAAKVSAAIRKDNGPAVQRSVHKKMKNEETDPGFSEAELARIEEIANNIDEVVTARKLTAADKAARAKYLEGHAAKMAGMAHHAIKGDAKSFKARNTEHGDYSKEPSKMAGIGLDHTLTKQDTKVSK
jgi:hypothetical protein